MAEQTGPLKLQHLGAEIAYRIDGPADAAIPGLLWLGGFKSDMTGTKAEALAAFAARDGRRLVRFDYFGHGVSGGRFIEGTIGRWKADAVHILDSVCEGPQILVGSSMGGWIALLAALARPEKVAGLVLIAPAPDFTEELMWAGFSDEIRATILREGVYRQPSEYDEEPYEISRALIEDGREHLLLKHPIALDKPVRILQGMQDEDVPWRHALKLVEALSGDDVTVTFVKNGDHRLSKPTDIARLEREIAALLAELA